MENKLIPIGTKVKYNVNSPTSDLKFGAIGTVVGHLSSYTNAVLMDEQKPHYLKPHANSHGTPSDVKFNYYISDKDLTILEEPKLPTTLEKTLAPGTRVQYVNNGSVTSTVAGEWGTIVGKATSSSNSYVVKLDNPKNAALLVKATNGEKGHWISSLSSFAEIVPAPANVKVIDGKSYQVGNRLPSSVWNKKFEYNQKFYVDAPGTYSHGKIFNYKSTFSSTALTGTVNGSTRTLSSTKLREITEVADAPKDNWAPFPKGTKVKINKPDTVHHGAIGTITDSRITLSGWRLWVVAFPNGDIRNYYADSLIMLPKITLTPGNLTLTTVSPKPVFVEGRIYRHELSGRKFIFTNNNEMVSVDDKTKHVHLKELVAPELYKPVTNVDTATLQKRIYDQNVKAGFHSLGRTPGDVLALIHSEVSEALEEYRKDGDVKKVYYDGKKPEGFMIELADVVIRVLEFAEENGVNMFELVEEKHAFNTTREHLHGGKKL